MNLEELTNEVKNQTGYKKKDIKLIVDAITTCIGNSLIDGEDVHIYKFGTFKVKNIKGRQIRNVKTGELQWASDYNKIIFEPTGELKRAVR